MSELDTCDYFALQQPGTNNFIGVSRQVVAGHLTRSNIEYLMGFTHLPGAPGINERTVKIMWIYEVKQ